MASLKLVCGLLLCMLVVEPMATTAITCTDVVTHLEACISYLTGGGSKPPTSCCDGVRSLNNMAKSTPDRKTACKCIQNTARTISGLKPKLAEKLPSQCSVKIPYKISFDTDCNKVK